MFCGGGDLRGEVACLAEAFVGGLEGGGELVGVDLLEEGDDTSDLAASFDLGARVGDFEIFFEHFLAAFEQHGIGFELSAAHHHAADYGVFV